MQAQNSPRRLSPNGNMDKQFKDQLINFIDGQVCLLGIGNRYWHDDGVGSLIAEALETCPEFASREFDVVDAGFIPY
jgi:hypothetical protein